MKTYRAALLGLTAGAALGLAAPAAMADGYGRGSIKDSGCCHNWGGIYLGLTAGWQQSDIDGTYLVGGGHNTDHDSGIVGGIIGIQGQWGNIVLGLEANWSGTVQGDKWGSSLGASTDCLVANRTCQSRLEYLATVGPRLGWAANDWMIYATGGYAQGSLATQTLTTSDPGTVTSRSKNSHDGWFLGAGVEWAVSKSVTLGLEYQRVSLDTETHLTANAAGVATPVNDRNMESDTDIIRARVTFKLSPDCCGRPLK